MFESTIHDEDGIVAWRRGTGDNVELTYILVKNKRRGEGKRLFVRMLNRLAQQPPYHTVYLFTRSSNKEACLFYISLGFQGNCTPVSIYKNDATMLFVAPYEYLVMRNCT